MKVVAIVPSAGSGKRLGCRRDKPFVKLRGKPILFYALKTLEDANFIDYVILVVSFGRLKAAKRLVRKYRLAKVRAVIPGGRRRYDSVKNGLKRAGSADFVVIHDGVRPFAGRSLMRRVLSAARASGAALPAVPARQTLKSISRNFFVKNTPERKNLWEAQTPQVFRRRLIVEAYNKVKTRHATDDASLAEMLGHKVKIVKGSYRNIKITTPEDLELAKVLLKDANRHRV
ncbi:MAG: 2-C-methyl-D-erythritol 4-phosphate cytidylyltransferase [Omnitrophica bacterium]|nr:2-C-methyl-D-erythritol 4-phosphate cytidylyltransferase [Candidatus Omnitrophota bacterium]